MHTNSRTVSPEVPRDSSARSPSAAPELLAAWGRARKPLLIVMDVVTVFGMFLLAYWARFHLQPIGIKPGATVTIVPYLQGALVLTTIWTLLIWRDGGYETSLYGGNWLLFTGRSLIMNAVYAVSALTVISFMYRDLLLSRLVYVSAGAMICSMMFLVRLLFRAVDLDLASQGIVLRRVVFFGSDRQSNEFARRLRTEGATTQVTGFIRWDLEAGAEDIPAGEEIGTIDNLEDAFRSHAFDMLIISAQFGAHLRSGSERDTMMRVVNFCEARGVELYMLPSSLDIDVSQREVAGFLGTPSLRLRDAALHPIFAVVKRIMDIVISASVLLLGSWLWAIITLAVKFTSRGPVFYSEERVGLHGKPYRIYKFRSMVQDADARLKELVDIDNLKEPVFNIRPGLDPRVTRVGHFLRRTSLDEIPQLWNVLKGEMSVVGPRPERVSLVEQYTPWQRRRLKAKPGITGYQQVMNRGDPSLASRIRYDLVYLKHQGLFLDVFILLKTVWVVMRGSGVVR